MEGKKEEKDITILEDDWCYKDSYQPTEDTTDSSDPPSGGSGVPEKSDE
ncbi:hypothetical protein [Desulfospira joergensenii]|nr:hypothetical protein [Desulfospira joergensenii]